MTQQQINRSLKRGNHRMLKLDSLVPYEDHPFKLYEGERLNDMVESIRENGVLVPIIVRYIKKSNSKFEILSGHNRVNAAKIAGYIEIPAIVNNELTDAEARLVVTETNLLQRSFSDLSHSERAISLAQHYNELKHQGMRSDLIHDIEALLEANENVAENTSSETQTKLRTDEKIAQKYCLSRDKVAKYIRLSEIYLPLLAHIDADRITFNGGYHLSFIYDGAALQKISELAENGYKISTEKATLLRKYYENGDLPVEIVEQIVCNKDFGKKRTFKLRADLLDYFFPEIQDKGEIEQIIRDALKQYFSGTEESE